MTAMDPTAMVSVKTAAIAKGKTFHDGRGLQGFDMWRFIQKDIQLQAVHQPRSNISVTTMKNRL